MHFWFMAAIFDLLLMQTSDSFQTCCTVFLDLRNVNIALKIVLLPAYYKKYKRFLTKPES